MPTKQLHTTAAERKHIAPSGALTWDSPAQRNGLLKVWRRAVMTMFGEQPRCLRVAWALDHLFNVKTGYAFPTNGWLAEETSLKENKVQSALKELEDGCAIVRGWVTHSNGQKQRVIYPARAIIPTHRGTPTVGVGGDPQQVGVHNLRRRPRLPKTQMDYARLAAASRERGTATEPDLAPSPVASSVGCPSNGASFEVRGIPTTTRRH
jgi:hypothetical protein